MFPIIKKTSKYDQEMPQSHSEDQPTAYIHVKHVNLGAEPFMAACAQFEQKGNYLLDNATQNIKAISLVVSDKKILNFFRTSTFAHVI